MPRRRGLREAVLLGHLVIANMHADDVPAVLQRFADCGLPDM